MLRDQESITPKHPGDAGTECTPLRPSGRAVPRRPGGPGGGGGGQRRGWRPGRLAASPSRRCCCRRGGGWGTLCAMGVMAAVGYMAAETGSETQGGPGVRPGGAGAG